MTQAFELLLSGQASDDVIPVSRTEFMNMVQAIEVLKREVTLRREEHESLKSLIEVQRRELQKEVEQLRDTVRNLTSSSSSSSRVSQGAKRLAPVDSLPVDESNTSEAPTKRARAEPSSDSPTLFPQRDATSISAHLFVQPGMGWNESTKSWGYQASFHIKFSNTPLKRRLMRYTMQFPLHVDSRVDPKWGVLVLIWVPQGATYKVTGMSELFENPKTKAGVSAMFNEFRYVGAYSTRKDAVEERDRAVELLKKGHTLKLMNNVCLTPLHLSTGKFCIEYPLHLDKN